MAHLGSMTQGLLRRLHVLAETPSEIDIKFNVNLTAQARVGIARAGGEADFRIATRWSPPWLAPASPPCGESG